MARFIGVLIASLTGSFAFSAVALGQSEKPEITVSGFFDGYYSYNLNNPKQPVALSSSSVSSAGIPSANNTYRYYDSYHNQLTLSLAELTVKAATHNVSILTDLDFGSFADLNASTSSPAGQVTDESSKNIGQAVVTYKEPGSRFVFDAGKMYSHLGVETVKSKDNFNYSRSILFSYAIPFWHTGVHVGYDAIPERLQTNLYVYNGWNTLYDNNRSKTLGIQIKYTPTKDSAFSYNFLGGPERSDSESDWKAVHELNASLTASDKWQLIADSVYGSEENALVGASRKRAVWYGALVGARYQLNETSYMSPRYELYRDNDGSSLGGQPQTIHSLTLTYGRMISSALETRAEARSDFSDQNSFSTDSGVSKSQTTFLVAMLAHF
jgi:hypothetical protein